MERLTSNKPVEEMSMVELAHNGCYMKDGYAWYRDFDTDIDARELTRDLMINQNLWEIDSDEVLSDEIFDETMMDNLQYGSKEVEGLIALFYRNLWAMADLHTRLKEYEDLEEQGKLIILPCKVVDVLWCIDNKKVESFVVKEFKVCAYKINRIEIYFENASGFGLCLFDGTLDEGWFLTKKEAEQAQAKMNEIYRFGLDIE